MYIHVCEHSKLICVIHLVIHFVCSEDDDFRRETGSIVFVPGGAKSQNISITINDDSATEPNERFDLIFSSPDLPADMQDILPVPEIIIIDNDIGEWSIDCMYSVRICTCVYMYINIRTCGLILHSSHVIVTFEIFPYSCWLFSNYGNCD